MKFSNFLFPHSPTPDSDYGVVTDALREAELTEELGFDAVWLGEHHIDGACAYVDPVTSRLRSPPEPARADRFCRRADGAPSSDSTG